MRNPISAAYQLFDDTLMYGANRAVRAYNWTFGGTKDELANGFIVMGSATASAGSCILYSPSGILITLVNLFIGHSKTKENRKYARLEQEALDRRALNLEAESGKWNCRVSGPLWLSNGVFFTSSSYVFDNENLDAKICCLAAAGGFSMYGVADYVMRGESLPPRKNVFSRALDKIDELVEEYKRTLAPQPVRTE